MIDGELACPELWADILLDRIEKADMDAASVTVRLRPELRIGDSSRRRDLSWGKATLRGA